jgi:beta-carotene 15,15'-dioxygenase
MRAPQRTGRSAGTIGASASPDCAADSWNPRPLARRVAVGSAAVVAVSVLAGIVAPGATSVAGPMLLVAAGLVGLPHGAVDHLALGWVRGRPGSARPGVVAAYGVAAVLAALAALAAPLPVVLGLLLLSAAHFAEGEAAFDRLRGGAGLAVPAAAMGTTIVAAPLVLRPDQVRPLLASLDPALPGVLLAARWPLLGLTAALVTVGLVTALRAGQRTAAAELLLVTVATLVGPALVVFALWFGGWHSPRHLVRLAVLQPSGTGSRRARRLCVGAMVPTTVAVAGLVLLVILLHGLPGAVLLVLLALTVPHAVVVARVERLTVGLRSA